MIDGQSSSLLSYNFALKLGIRQIITAISEQPAKAPTVYQLLEKYKDLFQGIRKLQSKAAHKQVSVKHTEHPLRQIPLHDEIRRSQ